MTDKTTEGVTAEPAEVEAVLHNLCGYHLSEPDAVSRYTALTREQVLYDALVSAIKRERGRALAELVASGRTLTQIADLTNLRTRQRVQRLIAIAKAAEAAAIEVAAASRDYEDRLAAVEATLDEVVSGIAPDLPVPREPLDDLIPTGVPAGIPTEAGIPAGVQAGPDKRIPGELDEPVDADALLEPTRSLPALAASLSPTKELDPGKEWGPTTEFLPAHADDAPWWRRNRPSDTGAA
jgi:hypothetical protein